MTVTTIMPITNVMEGMLTNTSMNPTMTMTVITTKRKNTTTNMLINTMKRNKMKKCPRGRSKHLMLILMLHPLVDLGILKVPWMLPSRKQHYK